MRVEEEGEIEDKGGGKWVVVGFEMVQRNNAGIQRVKTPKCVRYQVGSVCSLGLNCVRIYF